VQTQETLFLTPQQVRTLRSLMFFDGDHSVTIVQENLLTGRAEFQGHIVASESMGAPGVHIDRQGKIVPKQDAPVI